MERRKRDAEDAGGILGVVDERNSLKGKELMLLWLKKKEGLAVDVESSIPKKLLVNWRTAALPAAEESALEHSLLYKILII